MRVSRIFLVIILLVNALMANCQWQLEPVPGSPQYNKPVSDDTVKVNDYFNSHYSERVAQSTTETGIFIGRDTVIVYPLATTAKLKHKPFLKNDIELLQRAITYPVAERAGGVQGICYAYMHINNKGVTDSVWVEHGLTHAMDKIIVAAVKTLPAFTPARRKGKPVDVVCFYTIRFRLFE